MKLTDGIHVTLGYSFLYWSSVMRSADQVSRVINSQLNPAFSTFTAAPGTGPADPPRFNRTTDFWGHGLNFGVEINF